VNSGIQPDSTYISSPTALLGFGHSAQLFQGEPPFFLTHKGNFPTLLQRKGVFLIMSSLNTYLSINQLHDAERRLQDEVSRFNESGNGDHVITIENEGA